MNNILHNVSSVRILLCLKHTAFNRGGNPLSFHVNRLGGLRSNFLRYCASKFVYEFLFLELAVFSVYKMRGKLPLIFSISLENLQTKRIFTVLQMKN